MSGTLTTKFFTPASATTTWQGVAADETMSSAGIDTCTGYVDVAASDEAIADSLGGNFVPGANYARARDLVAQAREFAEGALNAGAFLARAGLAVADGATGAGAGAGLALTAARSAMIFGGDGLFADDATGDPDEASGQLHGAATRSARQTPAERLAKLREEIADLVAKGKALEKEGKTGEAKVKYEDAASIYAEIFMTGELLPVAEFKTTLEAAIVVLRRAGDNKAADMLHKVLNARQATHVEAVFDDSNTTKDVNVTSDLMGGLTPLRIAIRLETERYMGRLNPESQLFDLVRERAYDLVLAYVRAAVTEWFGLSYNERLAINPENPDNVPEEWFANTFRGLFELRGRGATPATAVTVAQVVGELTPARLETARQMGLLRPGSPIYPRVEEKPFELVWQTVTKWFDLPGTKRSEINRKNPNRVPESWFIAVF